MFQVNVAEITEQLLSLSYVYGGDVRRCRCCKIWILSSAEQQLGSGLKEAAG